MKARTVVMALLGLVVSGAGFLFAFWHVSFHDGVHVTPRVHLAELKTALANAHVVWLLAFAALNVSTLILRAFQTQSLVRRKDGKEPRWYACWQSVAVGMMMQNILPARLSEATRVVALVRAEEVSAAAQAGDAVAQEIMDDAARALGVGITNLLHVFDPRLVIVGGGVSNSAPRWWATVKDEIGRRALPIYRDSLQLVPAALGDDAGIYGAAALFV
jgi:hypothetical protein